MRNRRLELGEDKANMLSFAYGRGKEASSADRGVNLGFAQAS